MQRQINHRKTPGTQCRAFFHFTQGDGTALPPPFHAHLIMQEVTPSVVMMAVKMLIISWMMNLTVSYFIAIKD